MEIDKRQVVAMLMWRGELEKAADATRRPPDTVDHEEHQALLQHVGVDPQELVTRLG